MNKRIIGFIFCLILFNVQMFANEIGLRVLGRMTKMDTMLISIGGNS